MEFKNKLERLITLVNEYVKYLNVYTEVEVSNDLANVTITYKKPRINCYVFQSIEFPITDIDLRIEHYTNKIKYCKEKLLNLQETNK